MPNYTPTRRKVFNGLDEWGIFFDLLRLENEENDTYKGRLLDVVPHRANSTYLGLIYGITRELGLSLYDAATFTYTGTGETPVVVVSGPELKLYADYPDSVPVETSLWNESTVADPTRLIYMHELRDYINDHVADWTITMNDNTDLWAPATQLYNQSSYKIVESERVPIMPKFTLQNQNIIDYSSSSTEATIWFSDTEVFAPGQKKTTALDVLESGDWYIEKETGTVYVYDMPRGGTVRYMYNESPYVLKASPVEIYNLIDEDNLSLFFDLETMENGDISLTGWTALGYDVFCELKSIDPNLWGGDE